MVIGRTRLNVSPGFSERTPALSSSTSNERGFSRTDIDVLPCCLWLRLPRPRLRRLLYIQLAALRPEFFRLLLESGIHRVNHVELLLCREVAHLLGDLHAA